MNPVGVHIPAERVVPGGSPNRGVSERRFEGFRKARVRACARGNRAECSSEQGECDARLVRRRRARSTLRPLLFFRCLEDVSGCNPR